MLKFNEHVISKDIMHVTGIFRIYSDLIKLMLKRGQYARRPIGFINVVIGMHS